MSLAKVLSQSPDRAAAALLGATLLSKVEGTMTGGVITEVEAYLSEHDAAAHHTRGKTAANGSLFQEAGTLYLHCMRQWLLMDIVTQSKEVPSSILIRALRPTVGIEVMQRRRGVDDMRLLCNGPGKVCQALGVTRSMDGMNILATDGLITIELPSKALSPLAVTRTERIGVTKNRSALLRFVVHW